MGTIYRAVWTSEGTDEAISEWRALVAAWATESQTSTDLPEGRSEWGVSQERHRTILHRSVDSRAFAVTTSDRRDGDPTEWTTLIQVVADDSGVHVLVENSMDSDDLSLRVSVGRPRVVHDLLSAAAKPVLGASTLLTEPVSIPAAGIDILTALLANPERTLPFIVCSEPGGQHDQAWLGTVEKIARRAEGVAVVVTLDNEAVTAFRNALGDLAVWGGGIRVYGPEPVTVGADGWRHRLYSRVRLEEARRATVDRIVYAVAQLSTRRRIPDAFRVFNENDESSNESAPVDVIPTREFYEAREEWKFDLDLALEERSDLEKQLARTNGHLARMKDELIAKGLADVIWGTEHATESSIPDEVQDTSEAVLAAQAYLSKWLVLPDSAARELADIDTAPTSYAWGNTTWRGLRALAAYAEDRANGWNGGGFWEWCSSGPLLGWPSTSKKLSMTESESVQNDGKISRTRVFEVDRAVDSSGSITMLAHLKIAEGGGNLAPRVYFHDDTNGATRKVHVGLVGPHYLVPNKSTN